MVAANRDEFYARPAAGAHHWEDVPEIFAGRDLSAGGSWLGVTTGGRFCTVTNFAEETPDETAPRSRGKLVEEFLSSDCSAHSFAHRIHGPDYKGFNLLLYDGERLAYTSNRGFTEDLSPGVYGLANAELGATWPKVVAGQQALDRACAAGPTPERLIELLRDDSVPPDSALPRRGRPLELERRVAPCFIRGEEYGTRASTAVIFQADDNSGASTAGNVCIEFAEQNYLTGGEPAEHTRISLPIIAG